MAGIGRTPRGAVVAEDIRDLQGRPGQDRTGLRCPVPGLLARAATPAQVVERAVYRRDHPGRDAGVACCRLQLVVTEQPYAIMRILLSH
jgi:hypothetical protein